MKMTKVTNLTGIAEQVDEAWRPMTQKSVLDKSNKNFLRTLQLGEHGLVVLRGKEVCYLPMSAILALVEAHCPLLNAPAPATPTT